MSDDRITNFARTLVRYSIKATKGQTVGVSGGTMAEPLIVAVYEELLSVGAFPVVRMQPDGLMEILLKKGKPHHYTTLTPYDRAAARCMDATIRIHSDSNTRSLSGTDPKKQSSMARTIRPLHNILLKKPWVLTLFPTQAYAQDAEMSLGEFEDFVYGATFSDQPNPIAAWRALSRRQAKLIARLRNADRIRIVGSGTDLSMSVKGRLFINSDGHYNMPSGEVFTGPVEQSVEGHIEYDYPACYRGREINGVRLVFRKGVVVEASATKNESFLKEMLAIDPGARRIGELGIGTNTGIQRFTKSILFDEKIGGTVHLALGKSYPETGGKNKSALHWDMIKDLRKGGTLYVDGKILSKDGKMQG